MRSRRNGCRFARPVYHSAVPRFALDQEVLLDMLVAALGVAHQLDSAADASTASAATHARRARASDCLRTVAVAVADILASFTLGVAAGLRARAIQGLCLLATLLRRGDALTPLLDTAAVDAIVNQLAAAAAEAGRTALLTAAIT